MPTDTPVQFSRGRIRGKSTLEMANRGAKGPTDQKKVTLPSHLWSLIEHYAELQSEAYALMAGKTKFTSADLLELATEYYFRKVTEELGPIPVPGATAAERRVFIEKLAADNKQKLFAQLFGTADQPAKKKS